MTTRSQRSILRNSDYSYKNAPEKKKTINPQITLIALAEMKLR